MITTECNQKCSKCSHWKHSDKAKRLPVKKIVNGILSIPTAKELCIVGGEPLLYRSEIYKILNGIAGHNIRTVIITNGVLMNKEFIQRVYEQDIHIVVSIDTLDKSFWSFVRGANSYEKVLNNFEYATSKLPSEKLSIQSVLSKETHYHILNVSEYAKSKNVHHSIQDYISDGFDGVWTEIASEEPASVRENKPLNKKVKCFASGRNLSIMQNGDVYTCFQQSLIEHCQKPIGNLNYHLMNDMLLSDYAKFILTKMKSCSLPCKVLKCNTKN